MASVRISVNLTRNLGDYESVKVGADVEDTVVGTGDEGKVTKEDFKKTLDRLYNFASTEVNNKSIEAVSQLRG